MRTLRSRTSYFWREKYLKKVFISYNPYKLETEITVDEKKLKQNSKLREKTVSGARLQEWVEELPSILIDECNDNNLEVTFHGTLLDYEDLTSVFTEAFKRNELTAKIERRPAKETSDKEVLIDDVFKQIQVGPFDELRNIDIISAFQNAKSSDFEVCVVATMSAGKSTLINAMLGTKLMPSKQEACTAIISRIKDISEDNVPWQAEVYSNEGKLFETHEELDYSTMVRLNANENVSEIKIAGNIPFVSSEDVSLVLIDTPGPNNSRNPNHKKVQSEFLSKSSKSLVLYIMTSTFGTDDDNALLARVAASMAVDGKQSKDRFIFVVNKLDDRGEEDGSTEQTLERVRSYLKEHKVINPNLFPAAALPALNLRLVKNGAEVDEYTQDITELKVKRLNRNKELHFETFSSLPRSIQRDIAQQLTYAKESESPNEEALIHTGIISIEAAIRQYVLKYAKTAKIKNIVDTFMHKLDEVGCFEKTKRELAENRNKSAGIVKHIDSIRKKINDVNLAKEFKDAVDDAVMKVNDDSKKVVEDIIEKVQVSIRVILDDLSGKELDINDAKEKIVNLEKFAKELEPNFEVELNELIRKDLINVSKTLFDEYRNKLTYLTEEVDTSDLGTISIDPLKLMCGTIGAGDLSINEFVKEKEVEAGTEWVPVARKPILGWGLRDEIFGFKKEERVKYRTVHYIDGSRLAQEYLTPFQEYLYNNGDDAMKYVLKQSKRIAERFNAEFKRLDDILKAKLAELESYATDHEKAEERVTESERKLKWLEQIQTKIERILEI